MLIPLVPFSVALVVGAVFVGARHPVPFLLCTVAALLLLVRWHSGAFAFHLSERVFGFGSA